MNLYTLMIWSPRITAIKKQRHNKKNIMFSFVKTLNNTDIISKARNPHK